MKSQFSSLFYVAPIVFGPSCLFLVCTVVLCFLSSLAINFLCKRALIALLVVFLLLRVCFSS